MCGIVAFIGDLDPRQVLIEGLKRLEYRGYDSAGIAVHTGEEIQVYKMAGRIADLERSLEGILLKGSLGIGHTRWATHGEPNDINAHPHADHTQRVYVVHNGIIENYLPLKKALEKKGVVFRSETDTEVIANLVHMYYQGNLTEAVRRATEVMEGTFGIAVIHKDEPQTLVLAKRGSPLIIGIKDHCYLGTSDVAAILNHTRDVIYLEDNDIATLTPQGYKIITSQAKSVTRLLHKVEWDLEDTGLQGFPHYMLKEIFEQPEAIKNAMRGRIDMLEGVPKLGGIVPIWDELRRCRNLVLLGCGTSYYAALAGKYIFERLTDLDVDAELASEFRYRKMNFLPDTFVVAISQSGETADTLAAMKEARRKGAKLLGIVNVVASSIAREAGAGIYNHAGPEIGVASTKIYTSQLVILTLLALLLGRHQTLSLTEGIEILREMETLPEKAQKVLGNANHIESIAQKYYKHTNWLFLGRKYNYPTAMEGALKLKEISYIHAEGYAAGEMKHGPIALIGPDVPTVAIVTQDEMYEKMINNIQEVKSRKGPVIAVCNEGDRKIKEMADYVIEVPRTLPFLSPILNVIPLQLLAYYCARLLGRDIDKPRNLAKSVTVE